MITKIWPVLALVGLISCQQGPAAKSDGTPYKPALNLTNKEPKYIPAEPESDPLLEGLKLLPGQGGLRIEVVRGPMMKMTAPRMQDSTPFVKGAMIDVLDPASRKVIASGQTNTEGAWTVALDPGVKTLVLKSCPQVLEARQLEASIEVAAGSVGLTRVGCRASEQEKKRRRLNP